MGKRKYGAAKGRWQTYRRTAMRQMKDWMLRHGIKRPIKQEDCCLMFLERVGETPLPGKKGGRDRVVELYCDPEFREIGRLITTLYSTPEWLTLRRSILQMMGYQCMKCGVTGARGIQVDHIRPRSRFPWLGLEPLNLQVLCGPCNSSKSNRHFNDYRTEEQIARIRAARPSLLVDPDRAKIILEVTCA